MYKNRVKNWNNLNVQGDENKHTWNVCEEFFDIEVITKILD